MSRFHPFRSLDGLRLRLTVERLSTHALAYLSHPDDIPLLGERRHEPRLMTEAGLDFTMAQIAELPMGRELIRFGFLGRLGVGVIAPIELHM